MDTRRATRIAQQAWISRRGAPRFTYEKGVARLTHGDIRQCDVALGGCGSLLQLTWADFLNARPPLRWRLLLFFGEAEGRTQRGRPPRSWIYRGIVSPQKYLEAAKRRPGVSEGFRGRIMYWARAVRK